jgi:E3 ubiquitin ligase
VGLSGAWTGALLLMATACAASGVRVLEQLRAEPPVVDPVAGTETWTVEEIEALREGSAEIGIGFRRQVGIVAAAGPGPDGVLTAPESGVECVWWRSEKIRRYTEWIDGERHDQTVRVGLDWSRSTFTLTDDTGTLLVRAADNHVDGAPLVHSQRKEYAPDDSALRGMHDGSVSSEIIHVEHALLAGTELFVHGEAHDADEHLVTIGKPLDGGPFILSRQPEHVLRSKAKKKLLATEKERWQGYGLLALAAVFLLLIFVV